MHRRGRMPEKDSVVGAMDVPLSRPGNGMQRHVRREPLQRRAREGGRAKPRLPAPTASTAGAPKRVGRGWSVGLVTTSRGSGVPSRSVRPRCISLHSILARLALDCLPHPSPPPTDHPSLAPVLIADCTFVVGHDLILSSSRPFPPPPPQSRTMAIREDVVTSAVNCKEPASSHRIRAPRG